ncbi:MAG: rod shape-determining protein MreC [Kiritimatiellae bacterium]|nr:rod shape-determining protein MreC [Kiritimatiellia bacterium]
MNVLTVGALVLMVFRYAVAVEAVYPVERARNVFSRGLLTRLVGMFDGAAAAAENVRLKREVAELSLLRGDMKRLEAENARLRRAIGYSAHGGKEWVAAAVLSTGGGAAGHRDSIRVDRGGLAGVREGAVVAVPEGLVGKVIAVTPHTSEIMLVTDPSLKVACETEVASGRRLRGILSGGDPDLLLLKYLRNAEASSPRSKVYTSGLGGVFPRGIEVGTLLTVTSGVRGVVGEVRPGVEFSTLEDVFIRRGK